MVKLKVSIAFILIISIILISSSESSSLEKIRDKRGLRSFFKKIFGKKTTEETTTSTTTTTTESRYVPPKYSTTTRKTYISTTKKSYTSNEEIAKDPYYKLKVYCDKKYDTFCIKKKQEIRALVEKCDAIKPSKTVVVPKACEDVLSIYCYVYGKYDYSHCYVKKYTTYQPGKTKITHAPIKTTTTRRPYVPPTRKSSSAPGSPFGNGPLTSLPNDAKKLKEIGDYCLKSKGKDQNCDTALNMLKTRFKSCDKASKSDRECTDFKINFCSAFSKFPCCPDILAGRSCSGKSSRMLYQ